MTKRYAKIFNFQQEKLLGNQNKRKNSPCDGGFLVEKGQNFAKSLLKCSSLRLTKLLQTCLEQQQKRIHKPTNFWYCYCQTFKVLLFLHETFTYKEQNGEKIQQPGFWCDV